MSVVTIPLTQCTLKYCSVIFEWEFFIMQPALALNRKIGAQVLIFMVSFLKVWITELVSMKVGVVPANT